MPSGFMETTPELKSFDLNPEESKRLKGMWAGYDIQAAHNDQALRDWSAAFTSENPAAHARMLSERASIDDFFNGTMDSKLATLRAGTTAARKGAIDRALAYSARNQNQSRMFDDGGSSSYDTLLGNRNRADIMVGGALQDEADKRGDFSAMTNARLGLLGRSQSMTDADAARLLTPASAERANYLQNLMAVSNLGGAENANKHFYVKQERAGLDMLIDTLSMGYGYKQGQSFAGGADATSSGSGFGGSGGGGGGGFMDLAKMFSGGKDQSVKQKYDFNNTSNPSDPAQYNQDEANYYDSNFGGGGGGGSSYDSGDPGSASYNDWGDYQSGGDNSSHADAGGGWGSGAGGNIGISSIMAMM